MTDANPNTLPPPGLWSSRAYVFWVGIVFSLLAALVLHCSHLPKDYTTFAYSLYSYDALTSYIDERFAKNPNPPSIVAFGSSHLGWALRINDLALKLGYPDNSAINAAMPALHDKTYPALIDRYGSQFVKSRLWLIDVEDYWLASPTYNTPSRFKEQLLERLPLFLLLNDIGTNQWVEWGEKTQITPRPMITGLYMDPSGEWLSLMHPRTESYPTITADQVRMKMHHYYDDRAFDPTRFRQLNALVQLGRQHHIPMICIITPRSKRWHGIVQQQFTNLDRQARQALHQWLDEQALPVIDCQGKDAPCGLTGDTNFYDPVHLNRQGSKRFTAFLSERLKGYTAKQ